MTALLIGLVLGAAVGCAVALWLLRWRASAADLSLTAQERAALEDIRRVRLDALRQLGDAARRGQGRGVTTLGFSDRDIEVATRPKSEHMGGPR